MAITVLPIDASGGSPAYTAQQTREAFSAFLGAAPSGRPVGASSGVRPGTPTTTVYLSGTGNTTWNVAAHSGVLDTEASAIAGPYLYACDGTDTGTLTAADATYARIDIVYVQVDDTVQDGSGQRQGVVGYLAGTPASSPSAPSTPARSLALAQISVPKSGGGNPAASWVAPTFGSMIACKLYRASGTQSVASDGSWHQVSLGTKSSDPFGIGSTANAQITALVPGWYQVSGQVSYDSAASNYWAGRITQNGSAVAQAGGAFTTQTFNSASLSAVVQAAAGDTFQLQSQQNSGASQTLDAAIGAGLWLQATYLGAL